MAKLQISCRGLAKMDFLGKSDPYVEVYEYRVLMDVYVKIGETEVQRSRWPRRSSPRTPIPQARTALRVCVCEGALVRIPPSVTYAAASGWAAMQMLISGP